MIDWQTLVAAFVLSAAFLYVGRRGWLRIRSLMISKPMPSPGCGGCSGCGPGPPSRASDLPPASSNPPCAE